MPENPKHYDLEERTEKFASDVGDFIETIPMNIRNIEYAKQGVRSSGSVASNYIEANESFSKKDFIYRVKICRKEARDPFMVKINKVQTWSKNHTRQTYSGSYRVNENLRGDYFKI